MVDYAEKAPLDTPENPVKDFKEVCGGVTPSVFTHSLVEYADPEIVPLQTDLPPVVGFDFAMLPDALRPWLKDIHERVQCPPDFLAVTAMVMLAQLIGRKVGIHPKAKDDWLVIANLWGAIIGRPSAMKSPALAEVLKPLQRLITQAADSHRESVSFYEAQQVLIKAKLEEAERALKDAAKGKSGAPSESSALQNYADIKSAVASAPKERRYVVNDASVEKLGELFDENPNGLLLVRDELTGWMKGLEREDKAGDRAFFLEAFNGNGRYTYDRIGRGTIKIESTTLSIIGGIQPAKFAPYVANAVKMNSGDDGLIQRFQLAVYPDDGGNDWTSIRLTDRYADAQAKNMAFCLIEKLDAMPERRVKDEFGQEQIVGLRFTAEAQSRFYDWHDALMRLVKSDDIHPALESHFMKFTSLIPSLALIIELADDVEATAVGLTSLEKAIAWDNYLRSHAMRIYGGMIDPSVFAAKTILKRKNRLLEVFKAKDVQQKGWSGLSDSESTRAALEVLVEHHYLIELVEQTAGRPSVSYRWNKNLKNT
jgi:putative DNA primase/helicase